MGTALAILTVTHSVSFAGVTRLATIFYSGTDRVLALVASAGIKYDFGTVPGLNPGGQISGSMPMVW